MEFRKECFVNLNIWACDRKHAKHQNCRKSDFVMRTRRISKYHFQHQYMLFFEMTRDSYASASLSLSRLPSKFANSLDQDLRRLAKPNQGQTGIPRINDVSQCPTLRPMPRKNISEPFVCFCCFTSHVNSYGHWGTVSSLNHTFSWAGLSKPLTSNLCTYFRL